MKLPLEIRPISDAVMPAIAYEEDGRIVVEVDDTLIGRHRLAAVMAALAPYLEGPRALLLPALVVGWGLADTLGRHARLSSAVASTAATVAVGAGALAIIGVWDQPGQPPQTVSPAPLIITVTTIRPDASVSAAPPSASATPPPPRTSQTPDASEQPTRIPPSRTPRVAATATGSPRATKPPPTRSATAVATPTVQDVAEEQPETPTAVPLATAEPTVEASIDQPAEAAAAGCGIHVDVDPLADICLLD